MTRDKRNADKAGGVSAITWVRNYLDYTEPLTPEEQHEVELVAEVAALGYRPQCTRCGLWAVAAKSVAAQCGPVCRTKGDDAQ
ncbi:hypothetical protein [Gordonia rhizosphera]|uniref:Uncharacterized protein n=1 Tax=Gordonia rhizosphera NBRC 16068 TaxID=1108045 RepID=K6W3I9_9ACTN|nr:hypothetical protein [Gordonia rhizosphera]GAB93725.1 hypothetical protein GORHZ_242_00090 [Gordonia rhizosphera NBRC 16068]